MIAVARIPLTEQDRRIAEAVERESARLRNFILGQVGDAEEADDILEEAFAELLEALRLMKPIERIGAWLYRVARNRIIDRFRSKRPAVSIDEADEGRGALADLLPSPEAGPEAAFARKVLLEELEAALAELPAEQREVFLAHEMDGRSFAEISASTGVGVNTLLGRKHYAVRHLRKRLSELYEEIGLGRGSK